jgi:uncharacterized protein YgiM (DUF1202 family)
MDNEIDSIIPEDGLKSQPQVKPAESKKAVAPKTIKPVKPLVEGINSPKNTQDVILVKNNLSQKEKELLTESPSSNQSANKPEPRLMPESVFTSINKKSHHIGRWLLIFVVLLILVAGGYEFYVWKLQNGQTPVVGHYHPAVQATEPFSLAGGTAPTSTLITAISSSTPLGIASTTPTSTPPAEPVLQVKISSTPTGFLNVRSTPSSSGKVVTQVHPGEIYTYTKTQSGWYEITYSGLNQGWVSGQYVVKQ